MKVPYYELCPNCGHIEDSDGYGGNDCPQCWSDGGEEVAMELIDGNETRAALDKATIQ